jgi:hypothetical protein
MKFMAAIVVIAAASIMLSSCAKWAERPLIGRYNLVHPTGCRDDIRDSTLVVRDDGTFDQRVQLKGGQNESIEEGHWTYDRSERRINFSRFLSLRKTHFQPSLPIPQSSS